RSRRHRPERLQRRHRPAHHRARRGADAGRAAGRSSARRNRPQVPSRRHPALLRRLQPHRRRPRLPSGGVSGGGLCRFDRLEPRPEAGRPGRAGPARARRAEAGGVKVLVLAPYRFDTAPGQRFRIEQWMPLLERAGVRFEFDAFMSQALHEILYRPGRMLAKAVYLLRDYAMRLARCLQPGRYDAIFLHREAALIGPAWIERLLSASGIPIIYEFDDAIYVPYISPSNKYLSYLKFPQKTAII